MAQEVGPLEIDGDEFIEALLAGLRDIGTDAGSHAGIVHQGVEVTELGDHLFHHRLAVGGGTELGGDGNEALGGILGGGPAGGDGFLGGGGVGGVVDRQIVALGREREGDAAAEPATGTGDENDGMIHGRI